jgi:hypothetical protein
LGETLGRRRMSEYTKDKLDKLSLVELKVIAKELKISIAGSKTEIIKRILAEFKPQPILINTHQPRDGKKVIGVAINDKEKLVKMGQLVEKSQATYQYYSMGVVYFDTIL